MIFSYFGSGYAEQNMAFTTVILRIKYGSETLEFSFRINFVNPYYNRFRKYDIF